MKTNRLSVVFFCLLISLGTVSPVKAQQTSTAQLKSIHLFDMPEGVTEAELSALLNENNKIIERLGYKNAGYTLYKVEGEGIDKYHYYMEGVWPSAEVYKKVHEDKAFQEADKKATGAYQKIKAVELYRRLKRVQ